MLLKVSFKSLCEHAKLFRTSNGACDVSSTFFERPLEHAGNYTPGRVLDTESRSSFHARFSSQLTCFSITQNPILEKFLYNFPLVSDGMNYINKNYYERILFQEYIISW